MAVLEFFWRKLRRRGMSLHAMTFVSLVKSNKILRRQNRAVEIIFELFFFLAHDGLIRYVFHHSSWFMMPMLSISARKNARMAFILLLFYGEINSFFFFWLFVLFGWKNSLFSRWKGTSVGKVRRCWSCRSLKLMEKMDISGWKAFNLINETSRFFWFIKVSKLFWYACGVIPLQISELIESHLLLNIPLLGRETLIHKRE